MRWLQYQQDSARFSCGRSICHQELRLVFNARQGKGPGSQGILVAHLKAESPDMQTSAPRVFHLNRHDLAPWVIYLDG
jgi:hypothetical protein